MPEITNVRKRTSDREIKGERQTDIERDWESGT